MTHSLENMGGAQPRQHLHTPTLHFSALTPNPKRLCTPWGRARYCTNYSTKGGLPRKTDAGARGGLGIYGEAPSPSLPLTGKCVAVGVSQAQTFRVLFLPLLAQAPRALG